MADLSAMGRTSLAKRDFELVCDAVAVKSQSFRHVGILPLSLPLRKTYSERVRILALQVLPVSGKIGNALTNDFPVKLLVAVVDAAVYIQPPVQ